MLIKFFVSKPLMIFFYLLGMLYFLFYMTFFGNGEYWYTSFWLMGMFHIFFNALALYYFFLNEDKKIKFEGIDIKSIKKIMHIYFFLTLYTFLSYMILERVLLWKCSALNCITIEFRK